MRGTMNQTWAIGVGIREVGRVWWYLAAEEEDTGEAGGGDAAPDDDRRREQGPLAVDHLRFFLGWFPFLSSSDNPIDGRRLEQKEAARVTL